MRRDGTIGSRRASAKRRMRHETWDPDPRQSASSKFNKDRERSDPQPPEPHRWCVQEARSAHRSASLADRPLREPSSLLELPAMEWFSRMIET